MKFYERNVNSMKIATVVAGMAFVLSCATTAPISEANVQFQEEAQASIGFALRGMYSFGDGATERLSDDILAGAVDFYYVPDADFASRIAVSSVDDTMDVSVHIPEALEGGDRSAYFTALVAMTSKLPDYSGNDIESEGEVVRIFFEVIQAYIDAGYDVQIPARVPIVAEGLRALGSPDFEEFAASRFVVNADTVALR